MPSATIKLFLALLNSLRGPATALLVQFESSAVRRRCASGLDLGCYGLFWSSPGNRRWPVGKITDNLALGRSGDVKVLDPIIAVGFPYAEKIGAELSAYDGKVNAIRHYKEMSADLARNPSHHTPSPPAESCVPLQVPHKGLRILFRSYSRPSSFRDGRGAGNRKLEGVMTMSANTLPSSVDSACSFASSVLPVRSRSRQGCTDRLDRRAARPSGRA